MEPEHKFSVEHSISTIRRYLVETGTPPRSSSWKKFIASHADQIFMMDFTTEPLWNYSMRCVLVIIHTFGPSTATVRVYVDSLLTFEKTVELVHHDLWEVARILWPSGEVVASTDADGGPKITPDYQHPLFIGN